MSTNTAGTGVAGTEDTGTGAAPSAAENNPQGGAAPGDALEARLEALRKAVRTHEINLELLRRGALDLEQARAQAERATSPRGEELSAREAAEAAHRRCPHLFRGAARSVFPAGLTGAPRAQQADPAEAARALRARAGAGDRAALLAYLRARRGA